MSPKGKVPQRKMARKIQRRLKGGRMGVPIYVAPQVKRDLQRMAHHEKVSVSLMVAQLVLDRWHFDRD